MSLDHLISSLPKSVVVTIGLLGGLALIYILNPPVSKCDLQYEVFQTQQTPFLFKDPKKKYIQLSGMEKDMETCRMRNSPGSCFQFFDGVRGVLKDLKGIPSECSGDVVRRGAVSQKLWDAVQFIVYLAWGPTPPTNEYKKLGWFDTLNLSVFCEMKDFLIYHQGKTRWETFREEALKEMPEAKSLGRKVAWQRSLFSIQCSQYK